MADSTRITIANIQTDTGEEGKALVSDGDGNVTLSGITTPPTDLGDLDDVTTTGASQGEVLTYDSSLWVPSGITSISTLSDLSDVSSITPTTGQQLTYDGSLWTPSGIAVVYDYDNTRVSLSNSTSFLTWYEVSIPAGTLGANDSVLVKSFGSNYNQSGSNRSLIRQFQIICNGTTTATMVSDTQGSSSYYRPDSAWILFTNEGAVNDNFYYGYWFSHDQLLFGDKNQSTDTYDLTIKVQSRWTNAHASQTVYGFMSFTTIYRG